MFFLLWQWEPTREILCNLNDVERSGQGVILLWQWEPTREVLCNLNGVETNSSHIYCTCVDVQNFYFLS